MVGSVNLWRLLANKKEAQEKEVNENNKDEANGENTDHRGRDAQKAAAIQSCRYVGPGIHLI